MVVKAQTNRYQKALEGWTNGIKNCMTEPGGKLETEP